MQWLARLLRLADRGSELAERGGSLDDQADARFDIRPLTSLARRIALATSTVLVVIGGILGALSDRIDAWGPFGWAVAAFIFLSVVAAVAWVVSWAAAGILSRWVNLPPTSPASTPPKAPAELGDLPSFARAEWTRSVQVFVTARIELRYRYVSDKLRSSASQINYREQRADFAKDVVNYYLIVQLTHLAFSQGFRCFHRCRRHPRRRRGTGRCRVLPPRLSQGGGGRECVRWTIRNYYAYETSNVASEQMAFVLSSARYGDKLLTRELSEHFLQYAGNYLRNVWLWHNLCKAFGILIVRFTHPQ